MIAMLAIFFLLVGAGAGVVHFTAIARDAEMIVRGGSPLAAMGLRIGRMLLTVAVLAAAASRGWPVLLAAALGFMAARQATLWRARAMP